VYEAIVRRHGMDPRGDAITQDTANAITEHINNRIQMGFSYWPFPDLTVTEERAYRTVWNATNQFYRGDDVFFIPNATYYHVLDNLITDPIPGTPPSTQSGLDGTWTTNSAYFEILSPVDTYVAYDQTCKHSIGQALGVYSRNPRLNSANGCCCQDMCLPFRPSEKGIDVYYAQGPTVFVHFMLPPPTFSMTPWLANKAYNRGDRALYTDGNCYRSITDANTQSPNTTYWALEPFPDVLALYVKAGAYADSLRETISDGVDDATRMARMAAATAEAERQIQGAIDTLSAQGQLFYYTSARRYPPGVIVTQPWTGATVSELTDKCEQDWTFLPPRMDVAPPARGSLWFTGPSDPTSTNPPAVELQPQDMYLNSTTGDVFQFDGTTMSWRRP
jgi:hypothetical protein